MTVHFPCIYRTGPYIIRMALNVLSIETRGHVRMDPVAFIKYLVDYRFFRDPCFMPFPELWGSPISTDAHGKGSVDVPHSSCQMLSSGLPTLNCEY